MDPITFVFLLTTWSPDVPHAMVHVEDSKLTISDCGDRMQSAFDSDPMHDNGIPSCEIDTGFEVSNSVAYAVELGGVTSLLYPCEYEDSVNCVWDARGRGDGEGTGFGTGQSFADMGGIVYDLEFGDFDEIMSIKSR
jgi:hypothetical protein